MFKFLKVFKKMRFILVFLNSLRKIIDPIVFKYLLVFTIILISFHSMKLKAADNYLVTYYNPIAYAEGGCEMTDYNENIGYYAAQILFKDRDFYSSSGYFPLVRDASQIIIEDYIYRPRILSSLHLRINNNGGYFECFRDLYTEYYQKLTGEGNNRYTLNTGQLTIGCFDEYFSSGSCYNDSTLTSPFVKTYIQGVFISAPSGSSPPDAFKCDSVITHYYYQGETYIMCSNNQLVSLDQTCLSFYNTTVPIYISSGGNSVVFEEYQTLTSQKVKFLGDPNNQDHTIYCSMTLYELVEDDGFCKLYSFKYDGISYSAADELLEGVPPDYTDFFDPECAYLANGQERPEPSDLDKIKDDLGNDIEVPDPTSNYDLNGFDSDGIHKDTGTNYDLNGFDKNGVHKDTGTNTDNSGNDVNGNDENGFNEDGVNEDTGDYYDENGNDVNGNDENGFNEDGIHNDTGTGNDENGFNQDGIHVDTGGNTNLNGDTQQDKNDSDNPNIDNSGEPSSYYESKYPDGMTEVFNNTKNTIMEGGFGEFIDSFDLEKKFGSTNEYPVISFDFSGFNSEFGTKELNLDDVSGYNLWIVIKALFLTLSVMLAFRIVL
jgi:hypothetical protein